MAIQSLVRHHKSPCERAQILAAYEGGQGTQEEVAAQHGIAVSTLQRWLHQNGTEPAVNVPHLVEVPSLLSGSGAGSTYRVRFPRGLVLEVAPGFQAAEVRLLAELLQSL